MADKIRVLYVDDEPDLLELSRMFLERAGDFSVATIDSGPAALEMLEKERFDAIIADYHMPGMDGIQFLIEVRKKFGQVPFILFTGRGREEVVIRAISSGADLYIQKGGEASAQFAELAHKTRIVVAKRNADQALKESEEQNRRIIETAHEGIWAVNEHFVTTFVNDRMAAMLRCTVDEILGKTIQSFMSEEDLAENQSKLRQWVEGQPDSYELRFLVKDGSTRTFNVSATPLTGDDGSFQGSFAMLTDITDRKVAELALQTAHDNLELQVIERTADLYSANMKLQKEIEYSNVIAESLKEYSKMTTTLNEVIITANRAGTLPDLFRDSLDRALEMLDFEAGGIYLVNSGERNAEVHYSKNLPDDFIEKTRKIPLDAPPYDTLFSRGQPVITEHFEEFSPGLAAQSHILSLASIPLVSQNKVIGTLNVASTKRYIISADEIQVLTSIGHELGTTIARMIAEEEVKTVSVNLQTLFASINEMVFVLDMEGRIVATNDTVQKRLQYTEEELTGTNVLLLHVPDRRDEALRNVQGMIAGTIESCPVPLIAKDGTCIEVETMVTHGHWNGKDVLIGVTMDVTERKMAEEALNDNYLFMQTLIQTIPIPVFIKNRDGRYTGCNNTFETFFGRSRSEIIGKTVFEVAPKEIADEYFRTDEELLNHPGTQHYESRAVSKNGQARDVIIDKAAILNSDGVATGIIGVMFDITERKVSEKALEQVNKKLNLLSGITRHDINNQLTVLRGSLALLEHSNHDLKLNHDYLVAIKAAAGIAAIIRFTREYEQVGVHAPAWQDTRTLTDTAAKQAPLGQVIVKNDLPVGTDVFADPLIAKVFYNLMDNAVRYGGKITTIRFSVEDCEDKQVIVCEDDGVGVPVDEKKKIFERGFGKNTGLGLAISREILDITGITIKETGEPGQGARFEMVVPKGMWK